MILVTGGGGFLGGHIVGRLLRRGNAVRVLGRRDYPALERQKVDCRKGDIADPAVVKDAVKGCEAVIHAAAIPGVWGEYAVYYRANFEGTRNIVDACLAHGVTRLVYTSTPSVVHGGHGIEGGDESLPYPDRYLTPYAQTKALAERLVLGANSDRLATVALRPHLIFGPGDTQLIPKLLERARVGKLLRIGDGRNLISVSYVENVADAHLLALDTLSAQGNVAGRAFFINEPEPVNCWDFINRLVTGAGLPAISGGVPYGIAYAAGWLCERVALLRGQKEDPRLTRFLVTQLGTSHWFKVDAARRELGWEPEVGLDEGVQRLLVGMGFSQKKQKTEQTT